MWDSIDEYLNKVMTHLTCNITEETEDHYTYDYSQHEILCNKDYFEKCMEEHLSPYKALLFFHDYLNGEI